MISDIKGNSSNWRAFRLN